MLRILSLNPGDKNVLYIGKDTFLHCLVRFFLRNTLRKNEFVMLR